MSPLVRSPLDLIGNTPLVELPGLTGNPNVRIYGKLEWYNPCGSAKDRPARQMILDALADGRLKPGMRVIEATSGNTGTALAFVCRVLRFPLTLVVPGMTTDRKLEDMLRFGAEIVKVDGATTDYARDRSYEIVDREPELYFHTDQFTNPSNARAHELTTGPEILRDCPEVTHVVAAEASFGTAGGIGAFFDRQGSTVQIYAIKLRPGDALGPVPGMWPGDLEPSGRGEPLREQLFPLVQSRRIRRKIEDGVNAVNAIQSALALGYHLGVSAALVLHAALKVAREVGESTGSGSIVCIFADSGSKYPGNSLYDPESAKRLTTDQLRQTASTSL